MLNKTRKIAKKIPFIKKVYYKYKSVKRNRGSNFIFDYFHIKYYKNNGNFYKQAAEVIKNCRILPIENKSFFYSIDTNISLENNNFKMNNYTIDYSLIVDGSIKDIEDKLDCTNEYDNDLLLIINALKNYCKRLNNIPKQQYDAIESLFNRQANNLYEGLQRILFVNQFLWQIGHILNGLGRLDKVLDRVDKIDGLSDEDKINLIKDFFKALHSYYNFKSNEMLGDTGQIIILCGKNEDGTYFSNKLSNIFINVARELKLPDPKILLRVSENTPDYILENTIKCINTGIGQPLISNDEYVVEKLIDFGYKKTSSYNYVTSACWEPLVIDDGIEINNLISFNFIEPLSKTINANYGYDNLDDLLCEYKMQLKYEFMKNVDYINSIKFDDAPLYSLFSKSSLLNHVDVMKDKNITHNVGILSVGFSNLVNSLLNIKKYVYDEKSITLKEFHDIVNNNYLSDEDFLNILKRQKTDIFGDDSDIAILVSNKVLFSINDILNEYNNNHCIKIKLGLSSPSYLDLGKNTKASYDGRRDYTAFSTNISCDKMLPTQIINFASKLNYGRNCFNGDVLDIILSNNIISEYPEKMIYLLKTAIELKLPQMQFNVFDSRKLIDAKNFPEKHPDLVVRVWGFSAYYIDLPEEYKDLLINRAKISENI